MKPLLINLKRRSFIILPLIIWATHLFFEVPISHSISAQNEPEMAVDDEITIYQITPDKRGGQAYKLVYFVKVPIDNYWNFKTDFDNEFLVKNQYIKEHIFVSQTGNTVITKNKYANSPDVYFRWQTIIFPETYRLEFALLNPEECRQKYHYGFIQLASVAGGTRVTQVAYFDFLGASLWVAYPWRGGMKEFLSYTAHWEQETILHLKDRYEDENPK